MLRVADGVTVELGLAVFLGHLQGLKDLVQRWKLRNLLKSVCSHLWRPVVIWGMSCAIVGLVEKSDEDVLVWALW